MKKWKSPVLINLGIGQTKTCNGVMPLSPWFCCDTIFYSSDEYLAHQAGAPTNGYKEHCGKDLQLS